MLVSIMPPVCIHVFVFVKHNQTKLASSHSQVVQPYHELLMVAGALEEGAPALDSIAALVPL